MAAPKKSAPVKSASDVNSHYRTREGVSMKFPTWQHREVVDSRDEVGSKLSRL